MDKKWHIKKSTVVLSVLCAIFFTATCVLSAFTVPLLFQKEDFSYLYYNSVKDMLDMVETRACYEAYRDGGILFLDTEKVTQTSCDRLIEMIREPAERRNFTLETCSSDEAAAKGFIEKTENGNRALNCIWISVSDWLNEDGTVSALILNYQGKLNAVSEELLLTKTDKQRKAHILGGGYT